MTRPSRAPPDPPGWAVATTNTTANRFLGGKQQPAWMTTGGKVHPTPRPARSSLPRRQPAVQSVAPTLPEPILPSPAPSDEPSPAVSYTHDSPDPTSARLADDHPMEPSNYRLPNTEARFVPGPLIASPPASTSVQHLPYGQLPGSGAQAPNHAATSPTEVSASELAAASAAASAALSIRRPSSTAAFRDSLASPRTNTATGFPPAPNVQSQVAGAPLASRDSSLQERANKRRRVASYNGTKHALMMLERHVQTMGGFDALSQSIEKPRFTLLSAACKRDDYFFMILHQLFCAYELDPDSVQHFVEESMLVDKASLKHGIKVLDQLLKPNSDMLRMHCEFFANVNATQANQHPQVYAQIRAFLLRGLKEWDHLAQAVEARGYPLLVDELVSVLDCPSPTLQGIMFTCSRRRLHVKDNGLGETMEQMFVNDQLTNNTPSFQAGDEASRENWKAGIEQRNHARIQQYKNFVQKGRSSVPISPATSNPQSPALQHGFPSPAIPQGFPSPALQQRFPTGAQHGPMVHHSPQGSNIPMTGHQARRTSSLSHMSSSSMVGQTPAVSSPQPHVPGFTVPSQNLPQQGVLVPNYPPGTMYQSMNPQGSMQVPVPAQQARGPQEMLHNAGRLAHMQRQQQHQNHHPAAVQQAHPYQYYPNQQQVIMPQQQQSLPQGYPSPNQAQFPHQLQTQFAQGRGVSQGSPGLRTSGSVVSPGVMSPQGMTWNGVNSPRVGPPFNAHATPAAPAQPALQAHQQPPVSHAMAVQLHHQQMQQAQQHQMHLLQLQQQQQQQRAQALQMQQAGPGIRPGHILPAKGAQIPRHQWPYDTNDPKSIHMGLHQANARSPKRSRADEERGDATERFYQAVAKFANEPTVIQPRSAVYKFEFDVSQVEYDLLCKAINLKSLRPHLNFFNGSLRYRIRCITRKQRPLGDPQKITEAEWVTLDNAWPKNLFMHLNGQPLTIRRHPHNGKDQPAELTEMIQVGRNTVKVSFMESRTETRPKPIHFMAVEIVETRSHSYLMDWIRERGFDPPEVTRRKITTRLGGANAGDEDFAVVQKDLSVDLADPFSASLWKIPARGASCTHMECFDLEHWLNTRPTKPLAKCQHKFQPCVCDKSPEPSLVDKWKCPICFADARPYSLRIDGFMLQVREELEKAGKLDVKSMSVSPDGSWTPNEEVDDDDGSDGEGLATAAQPTKPKEKERAVEIIELD